MLSNRPTPYEYSMDLDSAQFQDEAYDAESKGLGYSEEVIEVTGLSH